MMKNLSLTTLAFSLSACLGGGVSEQNSNALNCFQSKFQCDYRHLIKENGHQFFMCDAPLNSIENALILAGFTVEKDMGWDGNNDGLGAHTKAPQLAHFHLSHDSVNCFVDGAGPLHCGRDGRTFIMANNSLKKEILESIDSYEVDSCLIIQ